ncbi:hypothetical protein ATE84_4165 [Aquimarina sp. MAR_2010_214]|uniref:hypothetical protein n=1 Tax=Aquimarina sp. MAR_2010_214 TaxID=1250026 RepID=UPI000C705A69|nr:hypothetical protein [Aquimarina sp. MAR_2010_214]PKV52063.1 hypothetical protein ATE84_4165 [Aquimarina sp. MAR_2010_214]
MLHIKKTSKIILLGMLLFCALIACNDDSSEEEQVPEETIIEDFANFAEDPKFLEYMEQMIGSVDKVVDSDKALQLLEEVQLTDQQNLQLAKTLGFDTILEMDEVYNEIVQKMSQLYLRFDLENQEATEIDKIINDIYVLALIDRYTKSTEMSKNDDLCLIHSCLPEYNEGIEPFTSVVDAKCGMYNVSIPEEAEKMRLCRLRLSKKYSALRNQARVNWDCCAYLKCGIIVPPVVGDGVTGHCGTPIG